MRALPLPCGAERSKDMIDTDNVMLLFLQLSGCSSDKMTELTPLTAAAADGVEKMLDKAKVTEKDRAACEYAAACTAVYDYVCREVCREQMAVTAVGSADVNGDFTCRIKGAEKLRDEALGRIAHLMRKKPADVFYFGTM